VIRVSTTPKFRKRLGQFPAELHGEFENALANAAASFGDVHRHSGLGLRKLGKRSYEIRVHLQWRIVLIHDGKNLHAFDIMNHDEVRTWLHGR
jgi:hypothetical protein